MRSLFGNIALLTVELTQSEEETKRQKEKKKICLTKSPKSPAFLMILPLNISK